MPYSGEHPSASRGTSGVWGIWPVPAPLSNLIPATPSGSPNHATGLPALPATYWACTCLWLLALVSPLSRRFSLIPWVILSPPSQLFRCHLHREGFLDDPRENNTVPPQRSLPSTPRVFLYLLRVRARWQGWQFSRVLLAAVPPAPSTVPGP